MGGPDRSAPAHPSPDPASGPPSDAAIVVWPLALVASALFWSPLVTGGSLHAYDWGSHHWNYFDWVRASLVEHRTLPLFMNDAWITKNFLANAEGPQLGPLVWLLTVLPTDAYLKLLLVVFGAGGLGGGYTLLRDLGTDRGVAVLAAVTWAWSGFFVAHVGVGHPWAMGGWLLPGLLCLYRRAALGSRRALLVAAAANAFTILGGQHQPFIWQNLFIGLFALVWALRERALFPLQSVAWFFLLSAGLGAVKLLPMLAEFADYDPAARTPGLPLSLVLSSLAGRGQGPEAAPGGFGFEHGSGWWEYAFYVGPVALAWLVAGALFARRALSLALVGALFLLLAVDWGLGAAEPWALLEGLPVWRTQRSPSRFLVLALFALTVVSALGLQRLCDGARARRPRTSRALAPVLALLVAVDLFAAGLIWQRAALGPPLSSRDHRPHPLRVGEPGVATAELAGFAPNRLAYRVDATDAARLVFPFRNGEGTDEWRVDGLPAQRERGKLAVDVPPGSRDLVMVYRPKHFHAGAALSGATLLALVLSTLTTAWRSRRSRS